MLRTLAYGEHPEQTGDLHLPEAGGSGSPPAVVLWHGGSYVTEYGRDMLGPLAAALARHGFVAYNATYRRLGSGGGVPETFDDALAAVDALIASDVGLDRSRPPAGIGFSAGAPLALHAAAEHRLSRVVDVAGVALLAAAARAGGPDSGVWRLFGGDASPAYARFDPAGRELAVPVLLLHGTADELVPVQMSESYARQLGDRGRLVAYAGAGHFDLHVPPTAATNEILAFLGERAEP